MTNIIFFMTVRKKASFEAESSSKNDSVEAMNEGQSTKIHVKQMLFPPFPPVAKPKEKHALHDKDKDLATNDFDSSYEPVIDIICSMIFVLPIGYDTTTEVTEEEDNG